MGGVTDVGRGVARRVFTPVAKLLLKLKVSPDAVTVIGTVGTSAAALYFYPRGDFLVGTLVIGLFVFSDSLDGTMARLAGRPSTWGAFLDSTLDRVADAAIFCGIALWFAGDGADPTMAAVTLAALVGGLMVSYARARAEGLGADASTGIAERTERLTLVLADCSPVWTVRPSLASQRRAYGWSRCWRGSPLFSASWRSADSSCPGSTVTSISGITGTLLGARDRTLEVVTSTASTAGYSAGWGLSQRLPEPWVTQAFDAMADRAARKDGRGVLQLRANLARARPDLGEAELSELTRQAMRSYLRYWREAFRLPQWSKAEIRARLVASHPERLLDPLASGQGVVAVLGHFGNWDHGGAWVTTQGVPFTTVAERLRPESLYDRFVAYRESLGMEVVPLTGGPDVTGVLQQRLRAGGLVALLADRELGGTGLEVDLLGEPARLPAGPALLALRTESVLVPVRLLLRQHAHPAGLLAAAGDVGHPRP